MIMETQKLKHKLNLLKELPGVYRMLDENGRILYVGKSIHVRSRVMSYFRESSKHSRKIQRMVRCIDDFEVYYTDTELDALVLECRWIKQYTPAYNTLLTKQDKYFYFDFYKNHIDVIRLSRKEEMSSDLRIGPFTNYRLAKKAYGYLKLRNGKGFEALSDMVVNPENAIEEDLEKQMLKASEQLEFEQASMYLEQLKGLKYVRTIGHLTQDILKMSYIAYALIPDSNMVKYYVVISGQVKKVQIGYLSQKNEWIDVLKGYMETNHEIKPFIPVEAIDECLIVYSSLKRGDLHILYKK